MGKKWRVIGGVSGFLIGAAIAVSGVSTPVGFVALMGGGAIGLLGSALAYLIYSNRAYKQFSIRDLLLVMTLAAVCAGWWVDRSRQAREIKKLQKEASLNLSYRHYRTPEGLPIGDY